jgi:hypothetical protein
MSEITAADLNAILSGDPEELAVHFHLVERALLPIVGPLLFGRCNAPVQAVSFIVRARA